MVASLEGALPLDETRRLHWIVTIAFCAQAAGEIEPRVDLVTQTYVSVKVRNHPARVAVYNLHRTDCTYADSGDNERITLADYAVGKQITRSEVPASTGWVYRKGSAGGPPDAPDGRVRRSRWSRRSAPRVMRRSRISSVARIEASLCQVGVLRRRTALASSRLTEHNELMAQSGMALRRLASCGSMSAGVSRRAMVVLGMVSLVACGSLARQGAPAESVALTQATGTTAAESTSLPRPSSPSTVASVPAPAATVPHMSTPDMSTPDTTVPDVTTPSAQKCPAPADYISALLDNQANAGAYDAMSLQNDLQAVDAFARSLPDFAGYELTSDKPVKIKVWVRGDLATHTTQLQAVVQHHDRLEIVASKYSSDEIETIAKQIVADAQTHPKDFIEFASAPEKPTQVVAFSLAPGDEALAQQYVDRWGDAVRIRVGDVLFVPTGCGAQPLSRKCPDVTGTDAAEAGLALSLTSTTPTIEQRGSGVSTLTVTNNGTKRFTMDVGGPLSGVLVIPGSTHVVGVVGGTNGVGLGIDLAVGESRAVDVVFGAFRCDGSAGSAAPAGTYGLRVVLSSEAQGDTRAYLSPEIPVTVTTNRN